MDSAIIPNAPAIQERLEALLVEVNGLANRLKSTDPTAALPTASRAALQLLQRYGPQTVPQIARARFSSRQNIQILINRLQQEGLVEFFPNPDHKRSALVRLTNRGHATVSEAGKEVAELNTRILPSFLPSELTYATEVLNKLRKLFEGQGKPEHPEKETRSGAQSEKRVERKPSEIETTNEGHVSELELSNSSDDGQLPVSLL